MKLKLRGDGGFALLNMSDRRPYQGLVLAPYGGVN